LESGCASPDFAQTTIQPLPQFSMTIFLLNVNNGKTAIRKKARPAPTLKTKVHEPAWPLPKMAVAEIRAQV
jgi:hypothetical protein